MNILKQLQALKVKQLKNDSRQVQPGDAFLAYKGELADGRQYIQQALDKGASAIVYEPAMLDIQTNVPLIPCKHLAEKLGKIAADFYPIPEHTLEITGVTGTNGKTTIAYQLTQAYEKLKLSSAYMGTLGVGKLNGIQVSNNTTPDALFVHRFLHDCMQKNISHIAMEVSSHGLALHRVDEVPFTQAIYTNLSHEHLDFHSTMDAYAKVKSKLFAYESLQTIILNQDDAYTPIMQKSASKTADVLTYGLKHTADIYAEEIKLDMTGSEFKVHTPVGMMDCNIQSLGLFNVYNSLAVIASLIAKGYKLSDIESIMPTLKASPGRMACVLSKPLVLVDYAHTPDALENALKSLNHLKQSRLIVVFGCGGDRDQAKRAPMGEIAARYADVVILTSDNPRTEDPLSIIRQIELGVQASHTEKRVEPDRAAAIKIALDMAGPNDMVLIAGKGHEDYQEIGHEKRPFSDEQCVRQLSAITDKL